MVRWSRHLLLLGLALIPVLLVLDLFAVFRLRREIEEEHLRAGVEAVLLKEKSKEAGPNTTTVRHAILFSSAGSESSAPGDAGIQITPELRSLADSIRAAQKNGEVFSRAMRNEQGIVLLRPVWATASEESAAAIVENQAGFQSGFFREEAGRDGEMATAAERALRRLTVSGDPMAVFRDEAYRLSLARCENLLKERDTRIEEAESRSQSFDASDLTRRRKELRLAIEEDRVKLRKVPLGETDLRLPILKGIRAKEKELQSLPLPRPTVTGSALRSFVWERMAETLVSEKILPANAPPVAAPQDNQESHEAKPLLEDAQSENPLRKWFFSAAVGSKLEARRRSLEVFISLHRPGLRQAASDVVRGSAPAIGVWVVAEVPDVESRRQIADRMRLYVYIGFLPAAIVAAVVLEMKRRRISRSGPESGKESGTT